MWKCACFGCKCPVFHLQFYIYTVHLCSKMHFPLIFWDMRANMFHSICLQSLKRITRSCWFLLNFPDADFAVGPRGSAQHVAMFGWTQSLNAVVVRHQLLLHHVSIRVHHVDLPSGFPLGAAAVTAHPYLRQRQILMAFCIFCLCMLTDTCESGLTWFLTLIMQTTPAQSWRWILMKRLFRSLQSHTHSSPASAKPPHSSDWNHINITRQLILRFVSIIS